MILKDKIEDEPNTLEIFSQEGKKGFEIGTILAKAEYSSEMDSFSSFIRSKYGKSILTISHFPKVENKRQYFYAVVIHKYPLEVKEDFEE